MGARARAGPVWVYRKEREIGKEREDMSLKKPKNIFLFLNFIYSDENKYKI